MVSIYSSIYGFHLRFTFYRCCELKVRTWRTSQRFVSQNHDIRWRQSTYTKFWIAPSWWKTRRVRRNFTNTRKSTDTFMVISYTWRLVTELRSRTLASIKPEISQAINSLIETMRTSEDAKIMWASSLQKSQHFNRKKPNMTYNHRNNHSIANPKASKLSFSNKRSCSDLCRTHENLSQGTSPSKKLTNNKGVKRYLNIASISNEGLLVVKKT